MVSTVGVNLLGRTYRASTMRSVLALVLLMLTSSAAGCLFWEDEEPAECGTDHEPEHHVGCEVPDFVLSDEDGQSWDRADMDANGSRWIAYFSATWCQHCSPTFGALDEVIPADRLLVFNKDGREQHSNLIEWREETEEKLNRTFDRPFMNGPDVADDMQVDGIPHTALIENGTVLAVHIGLWTDSSEMQAWFESAEPESGESDGDHH